MFYLLVIFLQFYIQIVACSSLSDYSFRSISTKICANDGLNLVVDCQLPAYRHAKSVPLLFIHGSGAGGWIWNEHWIPFFAKAGFPCYAISLRGSEATGINPTELREPVKAEVHVEDLLCTLRKWSQVPGYKLGDKPLCVGHSYGKQNLICIFSAFCSFSLSPSVVYALLHMQLHFRRSCGH
jgi:pimeloyl-ACP methyl ester carboxylesterase